MTQAHSDIAPALQRYLAPHGVVRDLRVMEDGHAGLTFGFELIGGDGAVGRYILKKAPEGVPRSGSTDVFRQGALLRALSRSGFAAPNVPWAHEGEDILGAPFIIMQRLPGRTVIVWDPEPAMLAQFHDPAVMWTQTAALMGALHAFDWRKHLPDWETPTDLAAEVARWTRLLRHMEGDALHKDAARLGETLTASIPDAPAIGLVHGDLQPGNVLFENGAAQGLIDWDLASIGPTGMDVGWLAMIGDADGWAPAWRPLGPPPRETMLHAYRQAGGTPPAALDWFQAFSQFRMTAITGLNVKLHRDGRRHDPIWEKFAMAAPYMVRRAFSLLKP